MNLVIFEDHGFAGLLPLVYSRATFNLRCGFSNLREKIEQAADRGADALYVRPGLAPVMAERWKLPINVPPSPSGDGQLWVNGRFMATGAIEVPPDHAAWRGETLVAANLSAAAAAKITIETLLDRAKTAAALAACPRVELPESSGRLIEYPWQLIHANAAEIAREFALRGQGVVLGRVDAGACLLNDTAIRIGRDSRVKPMCVLDAEAGPIHVGENVTILPNATITGPAFIGDGCLIQSGANIRGGTSLGPGCKVGGEVEATIFHGYSNKQHDGFVGHSYIGEWVNLGADTITSDLKHTYGTVRVAINGREIDSGEIFVGSIVGDHVKTGIGTRLPTGCVIGYASVVFLSGQLPKFVPSFLWLTDGGCVANDPARAMAVAHKVVARRKRSYSAAEDALFRSIAGECTQHERAPHA